MVNIVYPFMSTVSLVFISCMIETVYRTFISKWSSAC